MFLSTYRSDIMFRNYTAKLNSPLLPRILAAEDAIINQFMITQMLGIIGCSVEIAENGKEALSKLLDNPYDLILMDCMMPEIDGYKATEMIRKIDDKTKKNIPIIALTANPEQDAKQKCLNAGMNDYLIKPIKKEELQSMLEKWLNKSISNIAAKGTNHDKFSAIANHEILNHHTLKDFSDLMGSETNKLLHKYCDIAQNYINGICQAVEKKNFSTASDLSHQLKSSSLQIGASEITKLAASIEKVGRKENPNQFILEDLLKSLKQQQQITAKHIHDNFPLKQSA